MALLLSYRRGANPRLTEVPDVRFEADAKLWRDEDVVADPRHDPEPERDPAGGHTGIPRNAAAGRRNRGRD